MKNINLLKENGNKDLDYNLNEIETKAITYSQVYRKREAVEKNVGKIGKKVTEKFTENQTKILEEILKNRHVTVRELMPVIGISERKIKENIAKLKQKNLLKRIGHAKGGYWEIIEK